MNPAPTAGPREPAGPGAPERRRRLGRRGAVVLAAAALAALALAIPRLRGAEVPVVRAATGPIEQKVVASGRVLAPARIRVGTTVLGTVAAVQAEEGDEVAAGAVLASLDDREEAAAVMGARAGVAEARAHLEGLRGVGSRVASEELRRAVVALEQAERDLERARSLATTGAIPRRELEQAEQALETARSRRAAAAAQAAGSAGPDRRLAEATLARAEAALASAEARLSRTRIVAPAAGTVLERAVEAGDVVQPGEVLFVLGRRGPAELLVEPDEKSLALLRPGQPAVASADAFPAGRFPAEVARIAPAVDASRGTVEIRLAVPEPPPYLRPELAVSVEIAAGREEEATVLPAEAVRDLGTDAPWVLAIRDGRATRVPVRLGLRGEGAVEVLEGLAPGEPAILPSARVAPGERVRPDR